MTATTTDDLTAIRTSRRGSPLPALAGVGALGAFAGAAVVFGDPLGGAGTAEQAAAALAASSVEVAAVLLGAYAVSGIAVTGSLAARLGRSRDGGSVRLLPVLGAMHLLLMATAFTALAAAVAVGTLVFDTGVSPTATEAALVVTNLAHPMAAWFGAGFLIAVVVAARGISRSLVVVSAVLAGGLLLPPVGWAVTYLMALWFAGVGIWLWLRG